MQDAYITRESFKEDKADSEKSYFELETNSGTVVWANKSLREKCKNEINSVLNTNIFGLVDESFRSRLSRLFTNYKPHQIPNKTLWPITCDKSKMAWWMINIEYEDNEYIICNADLMVVTDRTDVGYKFAKMSADNTYQASAAIVELKTIKKEIIEINNTLKDEVIKTREDLNEAIDASKKAEAAAIQNKEALEELRNQVINQFNIHTKEIMKLMTSDVVHDSRMATFESHVKKTTTEALTQIIDQAEQSGKGLTKKITIPVGTTAAVIAFLQWIITKYFH